MIFLGYIAFAFLFILIGIIMTIIGVAKAYAINKDEFIKIFDEYAEKNKKEANE